MLKVITNSAVPFRSISKKATKTTNSLGLPSASTVELEYVCKLTRSDKRHSQLIQSCHGRSQFGLSEASARILHSFNELSGCRPRFSSDPTHDHLPRQGFRRL